MDNLCKLMKRIDLFQGTSESEIDKYLSNISFKTISYNKNQQIYFSGEDDIFMFLLKGVIKGEVISPDGKVIQLKMISAPDLMLPVFFIPNKRFFPFNFTVKKDVKAITIKREAFINLLYSNKRLLENFFDLISKRLVFFSDKISFLNFNTISKKFAYYLLNNINVGNTVMLTMTVTSLADYFGVERPSLSTVIGKFVDEGIIEKFSNRKIKILKYNELLAIIDE